MKFLVGTYLIPVDISGSALNPLFNLQRSTWLTQLPGKVQAALFDRCGRSWKRVLCYIAAVGSSNNMDDRFSVGQVSSGQYHNVAVTAKGAVYTFGGIEEGCLGRGGCEYGVDNMPRPVPGLQRIRVSQVSAWRSTPMDSQLVNLRTCEWSTFL